MASHHSSRSARQSRRRASRLLLIVLSVVVSLGAVVYLHNIQKSRAATAKLTAQASGATSAAGQVASPAGLNPAPSHVLLPANGVLPSSAFGKSATPLATATPSGAAKPTASTGAAPAAPAKPATPPLPTAPPAPAGLAAQLINEAKAKAETDPVAARAILNEPYAAGRFSGADAEAVRGYMMQLNAKLIFSPRQYAADPAVEFVQVESGHGLIAIARQHFVPWEAITRMNGVSDRRIRVGQSLKVPKGPFNFVVSKSAFRLDVYLGGLPGESGAIYITSMPVGLGKDDSTPTGLWVVTPGTKNKNPLWTNPRTNETFRGDDPKNPLGGFWMGITGQDGNAVGKQSYGIHGTIEPDSVGKQASMGCVRLRHDDIALVYDLATEGRTRVLVRD